MASVSSDDRDNRRIQFTHPDGRRKTIYVGQVSKKQAESIKLKVEALIAAAKARLPLDAETAGWTAAVSDELAGKLAAVGLIPQRQSETLGGFLAGYIDRRRADSKGGTVINIERVATELNAFFGEGTGLRDITRQRADEFRTHYLTRTPKLAPATIHRRLKTARMFFAHAVEMSLVDTNPFKGVNVPNVLPAAKRHYVSAADTERLLAVCNPTWRVIVALARYGGLRCPNEVLVAEVGARGLRHRPDDRDQRQDGTPRGQGRTGWCRCSRGCGRCLEVGVGTGTRRGPCTSSAGTTGRSP